MCVCVIELRTSTRGYDFRVGWTTARRSTGRVGSETHFGSSRFDFFEFYTYLSRYEIKNETEKVKTIDFWKNL